MVKKPRYSVVFPNNRANTIKQNIVTGTEASIAVIYHFNGIFCKSGRPGCVISFRQNTTTITIKGYVSRIAIHRKSHAF